MRSLPLYPEPPRSAIEGSDRLDVDTSCRRCALGGRGRATCLPGEGEPGGALIVLDFPGRDEEVAGRPLAARTGIYLRGLIKRFYSGPVAFDHAVRCVPGQDGAADSVDACRPFLAQTLAEVAPSRILCLGSHAMASVLGRSLSSADVRRGFAWLNIDGAHPIPVFLLGNPALAARNRLVRSEWFEPDLKWALNATPPVPASAWQGTVHVIETLDEARAVLEDCRASDWTSLDVEWAGHPFDADHVVLSVSLTPYDGEHGGHAGVMRGAYLFDHQALSNPDIRAALARWIADPSAKKLGSNLKADILALRSAFGVALAGQVGDTRFMRKVLESDARADLATMAELVGLGGHKEEMETAASKGVAFVRSEARKGRTHPDIVRSLTSLHTKPTGALPSHIAAVLGGGNPKTYRMGFVQPDLLHRYNARDTVTTAHLHVELTRRLKADDPNLERVWNRLVLPVAQALAQVETWGMPVDRASLSNFGAYLNAELEQVSKRFAAYGPDFNPNSAADVSNLLFKTLGITPTSFTDSGKPSTDKEALAEYAKQHPVANDLLRYRKLAKLKGTYADGDDGEGGLLTHVRSDSRIHPSINPDGAKTGRTSSSGPNLQNIPRSDTVEGKLLRDCFVAPAGWVFVELDHSQLELRIAADQSGDEQMLDIFKSGEDYHLRTARMIAPQAWPGKDPQSITKESPERTIAKTVNFGVLYDDDPYGLAFRLGVPVAQATRIRDALFGRFKKLADYIQGCVRDSMKTGTARTWWDGAPARRRWLTQLGEVDEKLRKTARRGSWNTPIQGTGSDYLLAGLVSVVDWIMSENVPAQVCVPVHDSILALVREDVLDEYLYVVPRLMTGFPTRSGVPLVVDGKVGRTWGSMEKVKFK